MTNYERIKAMSVEEMAEFICSIYDDNYDLSMINKIIEGDTIYRYNEYRIKDWLNLEAKN